MAVEEAGDKKHVDDAGPSPQEDGQSAAGNLDEEARKLLDGATMLTAPCKVHIHQERLHSMVTWVARCLQTIETAVLGQQELLGKYGKRLEFIEQGVPCAVPLVAAEAGHADQPIRLSRTDISTVASTPGAGDRLDSASAAQWATRPTVVSPTAFADPKCGETPAAAGTAISSADGRSGTAMSSADWRSGTALSSADGYASVKAADLAAAGVQDEGSGQGNFMPSAGRRSPSKMVDLTAAAAQYPQQNVENSLLPLDAQRIPETEALRLSSQQGDLEGISEDEQINLNNNALWPHPSHTPLGSRERSPFESPFGSRCPSRLQSRGSMASRGKLARKFLDHQETLRRVEEQVRGDVQTLSDVVQGLQHDLSVRIDDLFEKLKDSAKQGVAEAAHLERQRSSGQMGSTFLLSPSGDHCTLLSPIADDSSMVSETGAMQYTSQSGVQSDPTQLPSDVSLNGETSTGAFMNISLDESVFVSKPNLESALQDIRGDMDDQLKMLRERFESVQQNIEAKIECSKCQSGHSAAQAQNLQSGQIAAFVFSPPPGFNCASCGSPVSAAQMRWTSPTPKTAYNFPARSPRTSPHRKRRKSAELRMFEKLQHQIALEQAQRARYLPGLSDFSRYAKAFPGRSGPGSSKNAKGEEKSPKRDNMRKTRSLPSLTSANKAPGIVTIGLPLHTEKLSIFKPNARVWSPRLGGRQIP